VDSVETDEEGTDQLVIEGNKYNPESVIKVSLNES